MSSNNNIYSFLLKTSEQSVFFRREAEKNPVQLFVLYGLIVTEIIFNRLF